MEQESLEDRKKRHRQMMQDLDIYLIKADLSYQEAKALDEREEMKEAMVGLEKMINFTQSRGVKGVAFVAASYAVAYAFGQEEGRSFSDSVNAGFQYLIPDLMRLYGFLTIGLGAMFSLGYGMNKKALIRQQAELESGKTYLTAKAKLEKKGIEFP